MLKNSWMTFYILVVCFFYVSSAQAIDLGKVTLQGSIIESACSIDLNSRNQTVNVNVISIGELNRSDHGFSIPFIIRLVDCTLNRVSPGADNWNYFEVTFDGLHRGYVFLTHGTATGLGFRLYDSQSQIVKPGIPSSPLALSSGDANLRYHIVVVTDNSGLNVGYFSSTIKYKIDYF